MRGRADAGRIPGELKVDEQVYRRTDAGYRVLEKGGPVSREYLYILGLIGEVTPARAACARLHRRAVRGSYASRRSLIDTMA
jgi:hypothetical protein